MYGKCKPEQTQQNSEPRMCSVPNEQAKHKPGHEENWEWSELVWSVHVCTKNAD